jgi:hypothetical protein
MYPLLALAPASEAIRHRCCSVARRFPAIPGLKAGPACADHLRYRIQDGGRPVIMEIVAMGIGGAAAAVASQLYRAHRAAESAAEWILVANMNTLLRLDLDHLTGDDDNHGLREMRVALKEAAEKRPPSERKLLERYNALVGVAIAFGEKVHDAAGNVDMRAVANRRAHLQNALALGDRIEAALGGIAELANEGQSSSSERTVQKTATSVATVATLPNAHRKRAPISALPAIAAPASGARM